MLKDDGDRFARWLAALEERHAGSLTFAELRRCVQSLSSIYVQRREGLARGAPMDTAGRRAAFALYYGPLHFMLLEDILRELEAGDPAPREVLDLGCGTGVAGAAWSLAAGGRPVVTGIDRSPWAVSEARFTLRTLGLRGRVRQADLTRVHPRAGDIAVVAAFSVDELAAPQRAALLSRLADACARGARLLVVEPISRRASPWWSAWAAALRAASPTEAAFREDEWSFPAALPDLVARLDHAAGLDHSALRGRSLYVSGVRPGRRAPAT